MARILIVEDDRDICEILQEALRIEGHCVATASDGQAAIDWLQAGGQPQLVLLDLMMPRVDGWRLLARRAEFPALLDVPIVVLSGAISGEASYPQGAAAVLRKPVSLEALLDTVDTQLA